MTAALIATIIGVGATLLVAIVTTWRDIKGDVTSLRGEMRGEFHDVRSEMRTGLDGAANGLQGVRGELVAIRGELHNVGERVARIEGRLDERDRHAAGSGTR